MAHLNSAEGIQNMCATQIMTKSKSLRTGFLKPGSALDQGSSPVSKMHHKLLEKAVLTMIIGDENKLCSIRCTCVY